LRPLPLGDHRLQADTARVASSRSAARILCRVGHVPLGMPLRLGAPDAELEQPQLFQVGT
jgi:hypothetical protein